MMPIWQDKMPTEQDGKPRTPKNRYGKNSNAPQSKDGKPNMNFGNPKMKDGGRSRNEAEAHIEAFSVVPASGDAGVDRFCDGGGAYGGGRGSKWAGVVRP